MLRSPAKFKAQSLRKKTERNGDRELDASVSSGTDADTRVGVKQTGAHGNSAICVSTRAITKSYGFLVKKASASPSLSGSRCSQKRDIDHTGRRRIEKASDRAGERNYACQSYSRWKRVSGYSRVTRDPDRKNSSARFTEIKRPDSHTINPAFLYLRKRTRKKTGTVGFPSKFNSPFGCL